MYLRICLRRAAIRALSSSSSTSISLKAQSQRSIASFSQNSLCHSRSTKPIATFTSRRWISDAAETQGEPQADGATEAQHGDNSIANSASTPAETESRVPTEQVQEENTSSPTIGSATQTAQETTSSAADSAKETTSSIAESASNAAQTAKESVTGAAQSLSAAAGFDGAATGSGGKDAAPAEESKTVYVGNLFFDVRNDDLRKEFSRAGEVVSAKIIMDSRGLSKGFGYIEFANIESARKAIQLYHQQNFEGRRLSVQFSISSRPSSGSAYRQGSASGNALSDRPLHSPTRTLFIGNMSFDMSDRDLNQLFSEIKNVIDVRVAIDRRTGQPRGFAHADFVEVADAERAMEMLRGKMVCGRQLRVDFSTSTGRLAMRMGEQQAQG